MNKIFIGMLLLSLWGHPSQATDRTIQTGQTTARFSIESIYSQVKAFVSRQWDRIESVFGRDEHRSPYPGMDEWGNREGITFELYDPCKNKPCPPPPEDIETEEDRQVSFPRTTRTR